eukprot:6191202-Pleurochrysis_carterae.AAC.3
MPDKLGLQSCLGASQTGRGGVGLWRDCIRSYAPRLAVAHTVCSRKRRVRRFAAACVATGMNTTAARSVRMVDAYWSRLLLGRAARLHEKVGVRRVLLYFRLDWRPRLPIGESLQDVVQLALYRHLEHRALAAAAAIAAVAAAAAAAGAAAQLQTREGAEERLRALLHAMHVSGGGQPAGGGERLRRRLLNAEILRRHAQSRREREAFAEIVADQPVDIRGAEADIGGLRHVPAVKHVADEMAQLDPRRLGLGVELPAGDGDGGAKVGVCQARREAAPPDGAEAPAFARKHVEKGEREDGRSELRRARAAVEDALVQGEVGACHSSLEPKGRLICELDRVLQNRNRQMRRRQGRQKDAEVRVYACAQSPRERKC